MKPAGSSKSKPVAKDRRHGRVLGELRRRIVQGLFPPGARLPRRQELTAELGASSLTLQRAMDRLAQEGFIVARPRLGTFVAEYPPHLYRYGLVFSSEPDRGLLWRTSRFWTALAHQAEHFDPSGVRRFGIYTGVTGHADSEGAQQVRTDLANRRVSGLVVVQPYGVGDLLVDCPVPCAAFLRRANMPALLAIQIDLQQFFARALDDLARAGRKRVGLLCAQSMTAEALQSFEAAVRKRGMTTRPAWIQGVQLQAPHWACHAIQAAMQGPAAQRPDGLIVSDDHLVEHVERGLIQAGISVPRQLAMVAYTNFGWSAQPLLPVRRLGYVTGELLNCAVELLDQQNRSHNAPRVTVIAPRFEEELARPSAEADNESVVL